MNERNLVPFTSNQSREEAVKNGRKGGQVSGESRRERKRIREALENHLQEIDPETGEQRIIALCRAVIERAIAGDVRACEFIRDTIGEKPVTRVATSTPDPEVIEGVEKALFG